MKRSDHDGDAEQAASGKKCRRRHHVQHHSSSATPSIGAPVLEATARWPIPRSVSRELAVYRTQSPVVVDAVCTFYQNRHAPRSGSGVAMTLFEACIRRADLATVELLVDNGVCVDAQLGDSEGAVLPIHVACEVGHLEIVQYLVAHGARLTGVYDVFRKNTFPSVTGVCEELGKSPLSIASRRGHLEVVEWLVENGAPVDDQDCDGFTPFVEAVLRGDSRIARYLIAKGADATGKGNSSESAWYVAVEQGKLRMLKCFVESGLSTDLSLDPFLGSSILECATKRENLGILRYLLTLGGVFSGPQMNECLGIATKLGNPEIMTLLVSTGRADVNGLAESSGVAPIYHAIQDGASVEMTETLLALGADVNRPTARGECSAIHLMAEHGRLNLLQCVLRVCGDAADFNAPSEGDEWTPLHVAASHNHVDIVRFLLAVRSPPTTNQFDIDIETVERDTLLTLAASKGHLDVMHLLFVCEYHNHSEDDSVQWERGECVIALCIAARRGDTAIVEYLCELWKDDGELNTVVYGGVALREAVIYGWIDVVRVLLAHNVLASDDDPTSQHSALLCQAIALNYTGTIAPMLLRKGTDVNAPCNLTTDGMELELTPLLVAAQCGNLEMVRCMCEHGADVEGASNQNETALFFAAAWGKLDVVEYLVSEQNANIHSTSSYGFTPADVSFAGRHDRVYEYLLSCGTAHPRERF